MKEGAPARGIYGDCCALLSELKADCSRCQGLCCVALFFSKTDGFPENKPAGKPCRHLTPEFRCAVHPQLERRGLRGCTAFDCLGAGQKTVQIYSGAGWRASAETAEEMFCVFLTVWQIHQMLWYLAQARSLLPTASLWGEIDALILKTLGLLQLSPTEIAALDLDVHRTAVNRTLRLTASLVRDQIHPAANQSGGKNLMGKTLKRKNLDGRDLSMSLLVAANLEGCSLRGVNLLGTDLRDANLGDANLSECIFVTQAQVNSAKGNAKTKLPPGLTRPVSWRRS